MFLMAGTTFLPPGTASAPPVQKSFCTSIVSSTSRSDIFIADLVPAAPAATDAVALFSVDLPAPLRNRRRPANDVGWTCPADPQCYTFALSVLTSFTRGRILCCPRHAARQRSGGERFPRPARPWQ